MSEIATAAPTTAPASTPAAAPVSTPVTTPTAPASPAPSFNPKEHATVKGALDAFVKSKLVAAVGEQDTATPTEAAPTPVATTAEEPAEPLIQPAEKAQEAADEHGAEPVVDVGPDPTLNLDPKVEKLVSPKVRAVLKMLADPKTGLPLDGKVRREIVDNYYIGKSVRDSGLPVAAIRDYLTVAPTVDVLKNISENATVHERMIADYRTNPSQFAEQLYATDQEAFSNFLTSVTNPEWLQATFPKSFSTIAKTGTYNYLENALADARKSGDADLEAAAARLMEWGGLASPPQNQPEPQQEANPLQERVSQLEQERAQFHQERQQAFIGAAYQRAATTVADRITSLVSDAASDSPFNEKTQGRIKEDIGRKLYNAVTGNQHIIRTLDGLVRSGNGDATHLERVATYLQSQALALLPAVSREVIEDYSELVGPAVVQRQQRVEKALQQRPAVSSGGRPTPAPAPHFNPKQFTNMKDAFDAFAKSRLGT